MGIAASKIILHKTYKKKAERYSLKTKVKIYL